MYEGVACEGEEAVRRLLMRSSAEVLGAAARRWWGAADADAAALTASSFSSATSASASVSTSASTSLSRRAAVARLAARLGGVLLQSQLAALETVAVALHPSFGSLTWHPAAAAGPSGNGSPGDGVARRIAAAIGGYAPHVVWAEPLAAAVAPGSGAWVARVALFDPVQAAVAAARPTAVAFYLWTGAPARVLATTRPRDELLLRCAAAAAGVRELHAYALSGRDPIALAELAGRREGHFRVLAQIDAHPLDLRRARAGVELKPRPKRSRAADDRAAPAVDARLATLDAAAAAARSLRAAALLGADADAVGARPPPSVASIEFVLDALLPGDRACSLRVELRASNAMAAVVALVEDGLMRPPSDPALAHALQRAGAPGRGAAVVDLRLPAEFSSEESSESKDAEGT